MSKCDLCTATHAPCKAQQLTATHCCVCCSLTADASCHSVTCVTINCLSRTAIQCNATHYTATHCNNTATTRRGPFFCDVCDHRLPLAHCNTLQHTATHAHCNLLQRTATHSIALQQCAEGHSKYDQTNTSPISLLSYRHTHTHTHTHAHT